MFNPRAAIADSIAKKQVDLPPYPAIAMRLNKLLRSDDYTLDQIAELVSLDPALVVRFLRLANTSANSRGTRVESLTTALARLGARRITRLALAAALSSEACADGPLSALKHLSWRKSLMCAFVAQQLADEARAEEAFLCGLLRGLGRTIILAYLERAAQSHSAVALLPASTWLSVVGSHESQIGVQVARAWGLPQVLCDVLAERLDGPGHVTELVGLMELAEAIVDWVDDSRVFDTERLRQLLPEPEEHAALCSFLPTLPGLVESLRDPETDVLLHRTSSLIDPEPALLADPSFDASFDVIMVSGQRRFSYRAVRMGPAGCIAEGEQRVPEQWFARMELRVGQDPLEVWSKITRCTEHSGKVVIAFQPYASSGVTEARWQALVSELSKSAA